jgi:peptide/nickel transport system permease protein
VKSRALTTWRLFFRRDPIFISIGIVLVGLFAATVAIPGVLTGRSPIAMSADTLDGPSRSHWFGTDEYGRDIFTRVVFGARWSFLISCIVTIVAIAVGLVLGTVAGFYGGRIDNLIGRVTDVFFAVPYLVVAMAIGVALGGGTISLIISLGVVWWPPYVRLVRSQVLQCRNLEYVEAATAIGCSRTRILWRHILPTCLGPLAVNASNDVGVIIRIAAGLSFLGLGPAPPTPEWGMMVAESREFFLGAWWYGLFPGLAIVIAGLGFGLLGDALAEAVHRRESM